jgi:dTDP-4-dehydrorhamnose 3,5-epimerase
MPVEHTAITGLLVVRWPTHDDDRGFFRQTFQCDEISRALGRRVGFQQGNHSRSRPGVLRGFHAEPWDKLVYVVRGTVLAVVADTRPRSPTFARAECFGLGDPPSGERTRLFVSRGLANAFLVTGSTDADYLYDVSECWYPGADKRAVAWDDPDLAVPWPTTAPRLSEADAGNPTLRRLYPDHPRWRA